MRPPKLYVVVRANLPPGVQAVQGLHAFREFGALHPDADKHWFETSNHLALLEVPDEPSLVKLVDRAAREQVRFALFREPDRGMEATAVALEPKAQRLCRGLRLALRGVTGVLP